MRVVAGGQPRLQARVGLLGGLFDVAAAGIGHLERTELQVAILAPGDAVAAAMVDSVFHPPAFERRVAMHGQVHPQVARIGVGGGGLVTEAEHRQHSRIGQHGIQRIVPVVHGKRGGRLLQGIGK